eukprot:COSAG04_NODE_14873_length_552_cov_0.547461_1_plen_58_part_01
MASAAAPRDAAAVAALLAEVGALSASLAAREELSRCLRDDYLELTARTEALLQRQQAG